MKCFLNLVRDWSRGHVIFPIFFVIFGIVWVDELKLWLVGSRSVVSKGTVTNSNSRFSTQTIPEIIAPKGCVRSLHSLCSVKLQFSCGHFSSSLQAIAENLPLTLLTSLSVVSAFLIPLVGIIFGCFRCKGKCGGELIEEDLETNPKKHRQLLTAAISVCSALIMWV